MAFVLIACGENRQAPQGVPAQPSAASAPAIEEQRIVKLRIAPEHPTSADCLLATTLGSNDRGQYRWYVNDQLIAEQQESRLCGEFYKRGDQVTVAIGTGSLVANTSVVIANSPPKITGISAAPEQVFAGSEIKVVPVAEDRDGDSVDFRYVWLINGEMDNFSTDNFLPGNRFRKGDVIKIRIVPFDGMAEGPAYESYAMTIPNAPPRISSQPPQKFEALEYRYQAKASDPDGDQLAYQLAQAPPGMAINAAGLVTWPLTGVEPGVYPVKIVVCDPEGAEAFQEISLTLGTPSQAEGGTKP